MTSQICNLNSSQEIIRQENLTSYPPATACYVLALYPLADFLQSARKTFCELQNTAFKKPPASSAIFTYSYYASSELFWLTVQRLLLVPTSSPTQFPAQMALESNKLTGAFYNEP